MQDFGKIHLNNPTVLVPASGRPGGTLKIYLKHKRFIFTSQAWKKIIKSANFRDCKSTNLNQEVLKI